MSVTVSLMHLGAIAGTRALWPEKLTGLIAALEEAPIGADESTDRTQLLVIADSLDELDEGALAATFRYVARHPEIGLARTGTGVFRSWWLSGVKYTISQYPAPDCDVLTPLGPFIMLTHQLTAARKDLE